MMAWRCGIGWVLCRKYLIFFLVRRRKNTSFSLSRRASLRSVSSGYPLRLLNLLPFALGEAETTETEVESNEPEVQVYDMDEEVKSHRTTQYLLETELQALRQRLFRFENFTGTVVTTNENTEECESQISMPEELQGARRIQVLQKEVAEKNKEIKKLKEYISEILLHSEAQASAYQEKVTWMKLDVLLDSEKNVKKVKNALCGIPQVRDQAFDEKTSTVTIKVVCCSPEKVMEKLCSKGRGAIKRIQTIDPPKPPPVQKPKESEKPKEPEKPKKAEKPKKPEKPKPASAQIGPSFQPVTVMHEYYYPPTTMGQPMYYCNGPSYNSTQPNGCYERVIPDSYGGNYCEEQGICSIM